MEPLGSEQLLWHLLTLPLNGSQTRDIMDHDAALRQRLEQSEHEKVEAQNACCAARLALPHDDEEGTLADGINRLRKRLEEVERENVKLRAFKRYVEESLNFGDGSYRP